MYVNMILYQYYLAVIIIQYTIHIKLTPYKQVGTVPTIKLMFVEMLNIGIY